LTTPALTSSSGQYSTWQIPTNAEQRSFTMAGLTVTDTAEFDMHSPTVGDESIVFSFTLINDGRGGYRRTGILTVEGGGIMRMPRADVKAVNVTVDEAGYSDRHQSRQIAQWRGLARQPNFRWRPWRAWRSNTHN
jgi:hypothetical protein